MVSPVKVLLFSLLAKIIRVQISFLLHSRSDFIPEFWNSYEKNNGEAFLQNNIRDLSAICE